MTIALHSSLPTFSPSPVSRVTTELSANCLMVSEADYWENYYENSDVVYEWNNGYLEEKPVSDKSTILMYQWFLELLGYFLKTYPLGDLVLLETAFRLALPHKTTIRKPDLGLVLHSNPVPYLPFDKSYHGICDLCVEALSDSKPGELTREPKTKFEEYAKTGVTEYSNIHLLWYL